MFRRIQYSEHYIMRSSCKGFLYYPSDPFDLAVIWSENKTVVKPIIQLSTEGGYFTIRGESMFLRNFREDGERFITPDWAIEWIQDRINGKPYKIDLRMSNIDRFILNGAIKNRTIELQSRLQHINTNPYFHIIK